MAATPTVVGRHKGRKPKLMKASPGKRWSPAAEALFLDALACSANVHYAAAAAGFTPAAIYRQRTRRPDFAGKWQLALEQGYARLEMALVRAAADTLEGVAFDADRPIPPMTAREALTLLKQHAVSVGRPGVPPSARARVRSLDELRDSLLRKVEAIRRHAPPE